MDSFLRNQIFKKNFNAVSSKLILFFKFLKTMSKHIAEKNVNCIILNRERDGMHFYFSSKLFFEVNFFFILSFF